jgi:SAM-dependent methyltransferase
MGADARSARQSEHYDEILDEYDAHYGDATSREYRRRFFLAPLLRDVDLNDRDVADLAAGSGHTTLELKALFPRIRAVGFDVSEHAVHSYASRTGCEAHLLDLTGEAAWPERFDAAIIVGGLHHCVSGLDNALRNVARMLKPGALFLIVEPNRDTWLEPMRRLWYRRDHYFESSTEAALSHDALSRTGRAWFDTLFVRYMGGPAYFLVYNSLVFRLPLALKRATAPPLMALERVTNQLPWRGAFPYFVAQWRRRPDAAL